MGYIKDNDEREYAEVTLVIETPTKISTTSMGRVREISSEIKFYEPDWLDGDPRYLIRTGQEDVKSISYEFQPLVDPLTNMAYQTTTVDKEIHPDPANSGEIPIYFPMGREIEDKHILGKVRIDGDTATIQLKEGHTFASLLLEGYSYIGMALVPNGVFPKVPITENVNIVDPEEEE